MVIITPIPYLSYFNLSGQYVLRADEKKHEIHAVDKADGANTKNVRHREVLPPA